MALVAVVAAVFVYHESMRRLQLRNEFARIECNGARRGNMKYYYVDCYMCDEDVEDVEEFVKILNDELEACGVTAVTAVAVTDTCNGAQNYRDLVPDKCWARALSARAMTRRTP